MAQIDAMTNDRQDSQPDLCATLAEMPGAKRRLSAQFRALLPEIEGAIAKGYLAKDIVAALQLRGIDIGLATYKSYLSRHRQTAKPPLAKAGRTQSNAPALDSKALREARADSFMQAARTNPLLDHLKRD